MIYAIIYGLLIFFLGFVASSILGGTSTITQVFPSLNDLLYTLFFSLGLGFVFSGINTYLKLFPKFIEFNKLQAIISTFVGLALVSGMLGLFGNSLFSTINTTGYSYIGHISAMAGSTYCWNIDNMIGIYGDHILKDEYKGISFCNSGDYSYNATDIDRTGIYTFFTQSTTPAQTSSTFVLSKCATGMSSCTTSAPTWKNVKVVPTGLIYKGDYNSPDYWRIEADVYILQNSFELSYECVEGQKTYKNCADGTKIIIKQCVDNTWKSTGNTCSDGLPPTYEPDKDTIKVITNTTTIDSTTEGSEQTAYGDNKIGKTNKYLEFIEPTFWLLAVLLCGLITYKIFLTRRR